MTRRTLALAGLLLLSSPLFAFSAKTVKFKTTDGKALVGAYIAPQEGKPVVVLLHGLASWKGEWNGFMTALEKEGWGSLAYDLRGHGDSSEHRSADGPDGYRFFGAPGPGSQWEKMIDDVGVAFQYLETKEKILRKNLMIGGASLGANVALNYAAKATYPKKVLLLSPGLNYQQIETLPALKQTSAKVLIIASPADRYAFESSQQLLTASGFATLWSDVKPGHGVQMLDDDLNKRILAWLAKP